ncbi:MAG: TolC family protein, partial [Tannerella sp.]|nr:TolC family protein [Tannerella sp.]
EQTLGLQRVGRASNLDELSARLDVQNQRSSAQNAQAAYQAALDNLKNLLMIPIEEAVSLHGNLNIFAIDNQTVNDSASHESMRMGSLRQSIAVIEAQRKAAHLRSYAPTLNLSWNAAPMYMNQYANPTADPVREWRDGNGQFSISLSFKLDNYLPWSSSRSQINSLDDALTKQQSLLMETSINHQNTVQKLFRDITRSEETLETISLTILVAEETLRMYEESYRSGAVDLQSLNSTRDNLRTTQNRLLSEQFNLLSLILELEKELNLPFGSITYE